MTSLSSVDPRMPNVFVVGAQKAATTSLASVLASHPDVFMSPIKEPNFFVQASGPDREFTEMLMPYGSSLASVRPRGNGRINSMEAYLRLFDGADGEHVRAEASPTSLPSRNAALAIRQNSPDAKIIAILRNPYDRTYSAYTYFKSIGREPLPSFEDAIAHELSGARDNWVCGFRHIHISKYHWQIQTYLELFGSSRFYPILFDDFKDNPVFVMQGLAKFLGISPFEDIHVPSENKTIALSNPLLARMRAIFMDPSLKRFIPNQLSPKLIVALENARGKVVRAIDSTPGSKFLPLSAAQRVLMSAEFEPEIDKLEVMLSRSLAHWRVK